jgi:hypothetical protein
VTIVDLALLKHYMNDPELTSDNETFISEVVLPGVQQELEIYLGRTVEPVLVREMCPVETDGFITLTNTPVWEVLTYIQGVDEVSVDTFKSPALAPTTEYPRVLDLAGSGMSATPWRFYAGHIFQLDPSFTPSSVRPIEPSLIVKYVGGYKGAFDQGLQLAIARVAARETERLFDPARGIRAGSAEKAVDSDVRGKGWTTSELAAWDWMKRWTVTAHTSAVTWELVL